MEAIIGLKELREHMDRYVRAVEEGKDFIVVRRSKPLFRITPLEDEWEEVIDFTKMRKGGVDIQEVLLRL